MIASVPIATAIAIAPALAPAPSSPVMIRNKRKNSFDNELPLDSLAAMTPDSTCVSPFEGQHAQSSQLPPNKKNASADRFERSGKWTPIEEEFANRLISEFEAGTLLDCDDGCTLRSYLARKLRCSPMRISKKYAGRCIGKLVFTKSTDKITLQTMSPSVLESLEAQFMNSQLSQMSHQSQPSQQSQQVRLLSALESSLPSVKFEQPIVSLPVEQSITITDDLFFTSLDTDLGEQSLFALDERSNRIEAEEWLAVLSSFCTDDNTKVILGSLPHSRSSNSLLCAY